MTKKVIFSVFFFLFFISTSTSSWAFRVTSEEDVNAVVIKVIEKVPDPYPVPVPEEYDQEEYIIEKGDSLSKIAEEIGTKVEVLHALNAKEIKGNKDLIFAGHSIRVPVPPERTKVAVLTKENTDLKEEKGLLEKAVEYWKGMFSETNSRAEGLQKDKTDLQKSLNEAVAERDSLKETALSLRGTANTFMLLFGVSIIIAAALIIFWIRSSRKSNWLIAEKNGRISALESKIRELLGFIYQGRESIPCPYGCGENLQKDTLTTHMDFCRNHPGIQKAKENGTSAPDDENKKMALKLSGSHKDQVPLEVGA